MKDIVWRAYLQSINPNSSNPERQDALRICNEFKDDPEKCIPIALEWATSSDPSACFFALHCIEHVVKTRWTKLTVEQKRFIRQAVLNMLKSRRPEKLLSTMMSKCLSAIIAKEWPQNWPTMLEDIEAVGEITALRIFFEEVFMYDTIPTARRRELTSAISMRLVPLLAPQLLIILISGGTVEQKHMALSLLSSIVAHFPEPIRLLEPLCAQMLVEENRDLALSCLHRLVKASNPKSHIPFMTVLTNVISPCGHDFENIDDIPFVNEFASLLTLLANYDKHAFAVALQHHQVSCDGQANVSVISRYMVTTIASDSCIADAPDAFFDLMSLMCDMFSSHPDDMKLNLSEQDISVLIEKALVAAVMASDDADDDLDKTRNVARLRSVGNRWLAVSFEANPKLLTHACARLILESKWPAATVAISAVPSSVLAEFKAFMGPILERSLQPVLKSKLTNLPANFVTATVPLMSTDMINELVKYLTAHGEDVDIKSIQHRSQILLSLAKNCDTRQLFQPYIQAIVNSLVNTDDGLSVSIMSETALLLSDHDEDMKRNIFEMLLRPCACLLQPAESLTTRDKSIAVHMLASIVHTTNSTNADQIFNKLRPLIPALKGLLTTADQEVAHKLKIIEILNACVLHCKTVELFVPDEPFALEILNTSANDERPIRMLVRQIAMTVTRKDSMFLSRSVGFVRTLMISIPYMIDARYSALERLSDDQNSETNIKAEDEARQQQALALLSRDLAELYRQFFLPAETLIPRMTMMGDSDVQAKIFMSCFESLYMMRDSMAVGRLAPVAIAMFSAVENVDGSLAYLNPIFPSCLRSIHLFSAGHESLGHELIVLASKIFDKILDSVGIEGATQLLGSMLDGVKREDVLRYKEGISSIGHDVPGSDKKRKRVAAILFVSTLGQRLSELYKS